MASWLDGQLRFFRFVVAVWVNVSLVQFAYVLL